MLKAKYISGYNNDLTKDKVYDVIDTKEFINIKHMFILIKNDSGAEVWRITKGYNDGNPLFKDVTSEYRNNVIDNILG